MSDQIEHYRRVAARLRFMAEWDSLTYAEKCERLAVAIRATERSAPLVTADERRARCDAWRKEGKQLAIATLEDAAIALK